MTSNDLTDHINELARRFGVFLNVQHGMPATLAGAGYRVVVCPQCSRPNALKRAGMLRCGACKHPLGTHAHTKSIMIAPVVDEVTYAIALHELGHCLHPSGSVTEFEASRTMRLKRELATLRDVKLQLLEESSAWEWAEAHALRWTEAMQNVKREALGSYERHARQLGVKVRTV